MKKCSRQHQIFLDVRKNCIYYLGEPIGESEQRESMLSCRLDG